MSRKPYDSDVWKPPDDAGRGASDQGALTKFKEKFRGRTVLVGKNGANAQLIVESKPSPLIAVPKEATKAAPAGLKSKARPNSERIVASILSPAELKKKQMQASAIKQDAKFHHRTEESIVNSKIASPPAIYLNGGNRNDVLIAEQEEDIVEKSLNVSSNRMRHVESSPSINVYSVNYQDEEDEVENEEIRRYSANTDNNGPIFQPTGFLLEKEPSRLPIKKALPHKIQKKVEPPLHPINVASLDNLKAKIATKAPVSYVSKAVMTVPPRGQKLPVNPIHQEAPRVTKPYRCNDVHPAQNEPAQEENETTPKKPTYIPHTLDEYKAMMEKVQNQKLGGLGPVDSDETRQAREKVKRLKEYAMQLENIQKEARVAHNSSAELEDNPHVDGFGGSASDPKTKFVIQQPVPEERIRAKERREKALAYAKQIPQVQQNEKAKNLEIEELNKGDSSPKKSFLSAEERAEREREKKLLDLEALHQQEQANVELIKKKLHIK